MNSPLKFSFIQIIQTDLDAAGDSREAIWCCCTLLDDAAVSSDILGWYSLSWLWWLGDSAVCPFWLWWLNDDVACPFWLWWLGDGAAWPFWLWWLNDDAWPFWLWWLGGGACPFWLWWLGDGTCPFWWFWCGHIVKFGCTLSRSTNTNFPTLLSALCPIAQWTFTNSSCTCTPSSSLSYPLVPLFSLSSWA